MQLLEALFAAEAAGSGAHPHPHPVLADAAHPHHVLMHQQRNHLREQSVQRRTLAHPELRQQAMVHSHPAAQPAKRRAVRAQPRQLPRRTHPARAGIQPQRHQQRRIRRIPARNSLTSFDRIVKARQSQAFHQLHHQTSRMIHTHKIVHALHHQTDLQTVRTTQTNNPTNRQTLQPKHFL